MGTVRRGAIGSVWLAGLLLVPAIARAHPAIDRGVALYEEADFEGALGALAEAETSDSLERTELLRLLATRALVHFALERHEALTRDLTMLASLEPDFDLGPRAPPALERTFDRIRARVPDALSVTLRVESAPEGARVAAATERDRAGMTHRIDVRARLAGAAEWREGRDGSVSLSAPGGAQLEAYAIAIGPGGARLARAGSEVAPRRLVVPEIDAAIEGGGSSWLWVGVGAAALVLAAVAVAFALGLSSDGGETTLEGPVIDRDAAGP